MKKIGSVFCGLMLLTFGAGAVDLTGTLSVNQTSDTAANAKINAMNLARRQILSRVLSQYSSKEGLDTLLHNTSSDELANLIESSSVSNEQISSDSYSATITMNIDNAAAQRWLDANGIKNWIPAKESSVGENFSAFIVVQNGIADWAELKRIVRGSNVDIETQSISGNQIVVKMPLNYRSRFTAALHNVGWKYTDNNGVLQVWK